MTTGSIGVLVILMSNVRYAVIADSHGNILALEVVLEDIQERGIDCTLNLGDSLYGPLEPEKCAKLLVANRVTSIRGNEDRILIEPELNNAHQIPLSLSHKV